MRSAHSGDSSIARSTKVNRHASQTNHDHQAGETKHRPPSRDPERYRLPVFRNATQANEGLWQAWLPMCPRRQCSPRAVLRMGTHEGGKAHSPRRLARAGQATATCHRQPPQRAKATSRMGGPNRTNDQRRNAAKTLTPLSSGGEICRIFVRRPAESRSRLPALRNIRQDRRKRRLASSFSLMTRTEPDGEVRWVAERVMVLYLILPPPRRFYYAFKTAVDWHSAEFKYYVDEHLFSLPKGAIPGAWEGQRTRRLIGDEEQRLYTAGLDRKDTYTRDDWENIIQFALETALREQELVFARWEDIRQGGFKLFIPAKHSKTKKDRTVLLSGIVLTAFRSGTACR